MLKFIIFTNTNYFKMKKTILTIFTVFLFVFTSCKVEPQPINYGHDNCYNCDMTVVSKTHAAQFVTQKGKQYMFDAAECMVWKINKDNVEDDLAFLLVTDYTNPGELVDAKTATFLISENIQSPMGANLTAFKLKEKAVATQKEHGGKLFTWVELKNKLGKSMRKH